MKENEREMKRENNETKGGKKEKKKRGRTPKEN
jgi:hypothetical protein